MSSLMNAIRRATGGKPRLEDDKPEDTDEDKNKAEDTADEPADEDDVSDDDDPEAEDDKDEPDAEEGKDDKDMSAADRAVFARGRKAERKRIGAILGSKAAAANPALAAHLAFATNDRASKVLAALKAAGPAASTSGLAARMGSRPSQLGRGGDKPTSRKDAGAAWDGALAAAGVKTRRK
ncbi:MULTISPECIES: hypothetical protein [unclassified Mesorhizobium]|uniref:hypothetical protein n=1 Tax=unclassified Mesorhizobium TaxID=325217 RepID=UPI0011290EC4|nr:MULTISPECIES: hypothetical protein [unclassified Mesorhizobium]MCA0027344.1 hypothetical protein [Mesorhizobium sp. B263B1A]TPJ98619.1 hypothetical protein FJ489_06740 [Mesorhizobium sp. B2-5-12]TPK28781.1 hypothetical protein FJ562_00130 [Mesorhizobium sp. B2-5-6]